MLRKKLIILAVFLTAITANSLGQSSDSYYFSKVFDGSMDDVTTRVKSALKTQGFGVITEIDMHEKLEEKLGQVDVKPYKILGACNPGFALQTLKVEENIGLFLPCKVLVKHIEKNKMEVVMVNPSALMRMLGNKELLSVADEVTDKFRKALEEI